MVDVSPEAREAAAECSHLYAMEVLGGTGRGQEVLRQAFARFEQQVRLTAEQANAAEIERLTALLREARTSIDVLERTIRVAMPDAMRPDTTVAREFLTKLDTILNKSAQTEAPESPCHALLRKMLNAPWSHHIPEDVRGEMDALLNKGDASHG